MSYLRFIEVRTLQLTNCFCNSIFFEVILTYRVNLTYENIQISRINEKNRKSCMFQTRLSRAENSDPEAWNIAVHITVQ